MLKKIFPPINELTVFVITATLLSMFLYMEGWSNKAFIFIVEFFEHIINKISETTSIEDIILGCISLVFFPILFLAAVFGPLFLPFSEKDLRGICVLAILIDASIIAYSNIAIANTNPSTINGFIAFYASVWVIYVFVVVRMKEFNYLMSDKQAQAIPACIAAGISIFSVYISINIFAIHWVKAYSLCSILTSILFSLGSNIYYRSRYNKSLKDAP